MKNIKDFDTVKFDYTNHRGEKASRTISVEGFAIGDENTPYHGATILLNGFCWDKQARRSFDVSKIDAATFVIVPR